MRQDEIALVIIYLLLSTVLLPLDAQIYITITFNQPGLAFHNYLVTLCGIYKTAVVFLKYSSKQYKIFKFIVLTKMAKYAI